MITTESQYEAAQEYETFNVLINKPIVTLEEYNFIIEYDPTEKENFQRLVPSHNFINLKK